MSAHNDANDTAYLVVFGSSYFSKEPDVIPPSTPLFVRLTFSRHNKTRWLELAGAPSCSETFGRLANAMETLLLNGWRYDTETGIEHTKKLNTLNSTSSGPEGYDPTTDYLTPEEWADFLDVNEEKLDRLNNEEEVEAEQ